MSYKKGAGGEALRPVIFRPLLDAQVPPYTEFIGMENQVSVVFKDGYVELYIHDGYTPGGWLISGVDIGFEDATAIVAVLNKGIKMSTSVDGTTVTYRVGLNLSTATDNIAMIDSSGLRVPKYVLKDCDGNELVSGANVVVCGANVAYGAVEYTLDLGSDAGELGTLPRANIFTAAALVYYNRADEELFRIDITNMLNEILPTISGEYGVQVTKTGPEFVVRAVASEDAGNIAEVHEDGIFVPRLETLVVNTPANYTVLAADIDANGYLGKLLSCSSADAMTITLPAYSAIGRSIIITQSGAGQVTIVGAAGVTVRQASAFISATREQYSYITAVCMGENIFELMGDLAFVE